jgi:hypothetical protein
MLRFILVLPILSLPALSQNVTGSITGTVVDKSGSQIPAAHATCVAGHFLRRIFMKLAQTY